MNIKTKLRKYHSSKDITNIFECHRVSNIEI